MSAKSVRGAAPMAPLLVALLAGCGPTSEPRPGDDGGFDPVHRVGSTTPTPAYPARLEVVLAEHELEDSYGAPRSGDRHHRGIDIHAPHGAPVVAALDGWVMLLRDGGRGGQALFLLDRSGRYLMYYAHLDRFAEGIWAGRAVLRGEILGYVGDTGNASGRAPHLHFEVAAVADPARWWEFDHLNAYAFLNGDLDQAR